MNEPLMQQMIAAVRAGYDALNALPAARLYCGTLLQMKNALGAAESNPTGELADRLSMWARVGAGSKEHSQDCEDAAAILASGLQTTPQET